MTVELVISIIGALFGSGGLIMIFMAGRRTGVLETTLASTAKKLDELAVTLEGVKSSARHEAGTTSSTVATRHDELKRDLLTQINAQGNSLEARITALGTAVEARIKAVGSAADAAIIDIHRRVDTALSQEIPQLKIDVQDTARRIENTVLGLSAQRADWDQLKKDIRELLVDVTRVITEMEATKHTLGEHGTKVDALNDKIATMRATLDRLMRLETELERLKDEISRIKRG